MIDDTYFDDTPVAKTKVPVGDRQNDNIVGLNEVAGVELVVDKQPEVDREVDAVEADDAEVEPKRKPASKRAQPKRTKSSAAKQAQAKPAVSCADALTDDELRVEILNEMIDRTRRQLISKELDIQLYQRLYNEALNTDMRAKCERVYTAAINERKEIQLRLKILLNMKQ